MDTVMMEAFSAITFLLCVKMTRQERFYRYFLLFSRTAERI